MLAVARALVVDDDHSIRYMVSRLLEREGYEVDPAVDGGEAIEQIQQKEYALILLDLMMPRVDGYTVLRYLEHHRAQELEKVVVMTALSPEHLAADVPRILLKPFDLELFTAYARASLPEGGGSLESASDGSHLAQ